MATSRLGDAVSDSNAHSQFLGCSKSYRMRFFRLVRTTECIRLSGAKYLWHEAFKQDVDNFGILLNRCK